MSASPRIGVLAILMVAMTFSPTAQASGCIELDYTSYGEGLHVLANTGRQLAFGLVSDYPGEGVGAMVIITPALCGGVGVGSGTAGTESGVPDPLTALQPTIDETMLLLPLP